MVVRSLPLRRIALAVVLGVSLLLVVPVGAASASPAGEAKALATLQADWQRLSLQQKLGTCNAYRRNANVMIASAADFIWRRPISRADMTKKGWARVYRAYFAWACAGAGRSPRPE